MPNEREDEGGRPRRVTHASGSMRAVEGPPAEHHAPRLDLGRP